MSVSIVLPCYNPPAGWVNNILAKHRELCKTMGDIEMVLVQDGADANISREDILTLKNELPLFVFDSYEKNMGKGYALRKGIQAATGDIIIYTDIDFPYTTGSIISIYHAVKHDKADVAVGIKDENYYSTVSPVRKLVSKKLRWMIRIFLSLPITDTQCGLKGFHKGIKTVFLSTTINRYLFDLEFIRSAHKKRLRLKAIPITLNEGVQFRKMNYRVLTPEFFNFIKILIR